MDILIGFVVGLITLLLVVAAFSYGIHLGSKNVESKPAGDRTFEDIVVDSVRGKQKEKPEPTELDQILSMSKEKMLKAIEDKRKRGQFED
jgi:hypothetical protein